MLSTYSQCIKKYLTDYYLKKAIEENLLYKVEKGIYSDSPSWSELALIAFKNRNAVFTMNSAFYYQDLTDSIPDYYYLGTAREASRISARNVKQVFYPDEILTLGVEEKTVNGVSIRIYSKERLLVELIRHRNRLPFDYYIENSKKGAMPSGWHMNCVLLTFLFRSCFERTTLKHYISIKYDLES